VATITFGLAIAVTFDDSNDDLGSWGFCFLMATLALTHVTLTAGAMKQRDPVIQRVPDLASMLFAIVGAVMGALLVTGTIEDSDDAAKILVADLILLLAMTDIATLLRRGRRG